MNFIVLCLLTNSESDDLAKFEDWGWAIGDWGLGTGDWGMEIGKINIAIPNRQPLYDADASRCANANPYMTLTRHAALTPIANRQSLIANPQT